MQIRNFKLKTNRNEDYNKMKPFISNSDIKKICFKRIVWCPEKLAKTFADVTLRSLGSCPEKGMDF